MMLILLHAVARELSIGTLLHNSGGDVQGNVGARVAAAHVSQDPAFPFELRILASVKAFVKAQSPNSPMLSGSNQSAWVHEE